MTLKQLKEKRYHNGQVLKYGAVLGIIKLEDCKRCGGSGKHSYNAMHGDICYGCYGKKQRYPKITKKIETVVLKAIKTGLPPVEDWVL
jgi:hypothetical protein